MAGGNGLMRVASRCVKSCHVAGNGKALQDSQRLITLLSALKPSWFARSTEFIGEFGIRFWFVEYGLSMKEDVYCSWISFFLFLGLYDHTISWYENTSNIFPMLVAAHQQIDSHLMNLWIAKEIKCN